MTASEQKFTVIVYLQHYTAGQQDSRVREMQAARAFSGRSREASVRLSQTEYNRSLSYSAAYDSIILMIPFIEREEQQ